MEEDFIGFLLAQTAITSLVTTGAAKRIYWNVRPQASALPAITLQRISDIPTNDGCGADPLKESRVQIDCWGNSFAQSLAMARAVEAAVSGKSFSHGGTQFVSVYIDTMADTTEPGSTSGSVIHRTRIDLLIWHRKEN